MAETSRPEDAYFQAAESRKRQQLLEETERRAVEEKRKREIAGSLTTNDETLIERINALERRIKQAAPQIKWCFIEPDVED